MARNRRRNLVTALVLCLVVLGTLAWMLFAYRTIGDRPRDWSYGSPPLTPAESYSSSRPAPPPARASRQVELPPPAGGEGEGRVESPQARERRATESPVRRTLTRPLPERERSKP